MGSVPRHSVCGSIVPLLLSPRGVERRAPLAAPGVSLATDVRKRKRGCDMWGHPTSQLTWLHMIPDTQYVSGLA